jgi:hypothetical protein
MATAVKVDTGEIDDQFYELIGSLKIIAGARV